MNFGGIAYRALPALGILTIALNAAAVAQAPSPVPSATQSPAAGYTASNRPEDPAVTKRAIAVYAQLVSGVIDRSKLDDALNAALTPAVVATISSQLTALGPVHWDFLVQVDTAKGPVSVYRLSNALAKLTLSIGINKDDKIWNLLLKPQQ